MRASAADGFAVKRLALEDFTLERDDTAIDSTTSPGARKSEIGSVFELGICDPELDFLK
jgi:hypothetical protein